MIIVLFILLVGSLGFAILMASIVLQVRANAKKRARLILDGAISTAKEINKIKGILAVAKNDEEAIYLWHKLEELN